MHWTNTGLIKAIKVVTREGIYYVNAITKECVHYDPSEVMVVGVMYR